MRLRDEVVLVTGGSSGIGLATARRFAREGARLVLAARDLERLAAAAAAVGGDVRVVSADLEDPLAVQALADDVARTEGRLDVLVNSGGQMRLGRCEELGPEVAERMMRVNYLGTVRTIDACLPLLRAGRRRSIVNLSSLAGLVVPPNFGAYAASKFALTAYSHALRQELRAERFHVGVVYPGPVDTPLVEGYIHTPVYPVPPGVPVISAERVAEAVWRCVRRRAPHVVVPRQIGWIVPLGQAGPRLVDLLYRMVRVRG